MNKDPSRMQVQSIRDEHVDISIFIGFHSVHISKNDKDCNLVVGFISHTDYVADLECPVTPIDVNEVVGS